jgi:hypothetical protein
MGKWTNLDYVAGIDYDPLTIYLLAYRPPESPEGSCHTIKIKVNPKSESGDRMTTAQAGPGLWGGGMSCSHSRRRQTDATCVSIIVRNTATSHIPHPILCMEPRPARGWKVL